MIQYTDIMINNKEKNTMTKLSKNAMSDIEKYNELREQELTEKNTMTKKDDEVKRQFWALVLSAKINVLQIKTCISSLQDRMFDAIHTDTDMSLEEWLKKAVKYNWIEDNRK